MELIKTVINLYSFSIAVYAMLITIVLLILVFRYKSRKIRYLDWKKDTLNLYLFKREWERNDDKLLQELFDENLSLERRVKELDKDVTKLSFFGLLMVLLIKIGVKCFCYKR